MEPFSRWQDSPSEPWRVLAERKIAEWILQGQSKDLPGQGQPLAFEVNPFEPPDMRLANKILKNAGFVPPWIEAGQQVETQRARLDLERDRLRQELARLKRIGQPADPRQQRDRERLRARVGRYLALVRETNASIETFNLQVPSIGLQCPRIALGREINRLIDEGFPLPNGEA